MRGLLLMMILYIMSKVLGMRSLVRIVHIVFTLLCIFEYNHCITFKDIEE